MKFNHLVLILILVLFFTAAVGCVDESTGGFNPLGKNISAIEHSDIQNVPIPENMSQYIQVNASTIPPYPANQLVLESDLAFYGTFKEFSSYQSVEYDTTLSDLVFIIVDPIKGTAGEEAVIRVTGGEVDNVIVYWAGGSPSPWDFESGKQYMIYAVKSGGSYQILPGGAFNVNN